MKTFLVPQEQSLVLKELGFDKKCWGVWVNGRFEPRYKSKNSTFKPNQKLDKRNVDYCTAPTFEQAFDWFRSIGYDTSISHTPPELIGRGRIKKYSYFIWKESDNPRGTQSFEDTYEEARLECLKKLIELSKN